ncbi:odorant receptor 85c-like [Nymphalis io]|uniref:odorant receptor 85c-like n=1 Tax=Inachis io TaxID=171585 RepID=UPI002167F06A|nr:odorant receptor 85c-like [Nymphalis io]
MGGTNLIELAVDLSFSFNCIEGSLLYLHFCGIKNRIKNYVVKLGKQWRNDDSLTARSITMKRNQIKQIDIYTLVYCTLVKVFVHTYFASPLIIILIKKFLLNIEVDYTTPFKFTLPFDYQSNVFIFGGVYLMDYMIACNISYVVTCSLFFISVTMSQLRTLFMLLQEDIREVIKLNNVDVQIKLIVQRHSVLSDLLIEMSDAFGAIFAIHLVFLSVTICFYGIAARINSRLEDLKNFLISVITTINIYNCCRHGQLVTDSALDIATVAYDSAWEDLSCKNKKIILLTILRSQQASYIRSMKCSEISFKTFITESRPVTTTEIYI